MIPINIFLTLLDFLVNSAWRLGKNIPSWEKFGQRKGDEMRWKDFKFDTETHMQIAHCIEQHLAKRLWYTREIHQYVFVKWKNISIINLLLGEVRLHSADGTEFNYCAPRKPISSWNLSSHMLASVFLWIMGCTSASTERKKKLSFLLERKITHSSECVCVYIYSSYSYIKPKLGFKLGVYSNQLFICIKQHFPANRHFQ